MINISNLLFSVIVGVPTGIWTYNNFFNQDYKIKKRIKGDLQYLFQEKGVKNSKELYPKVTDIELLNYGFKAYLDIRRVCSYKDIENLNDLINTIFSGSETNILNNTKEIVIEVINNPIKDISFHFIPLEKYQIPVGFNYQGDPIIVNLKNCSGLLINGVPGVGKSCLLKQIINTLKFNGVSKMYYAQIVKSDLEKEGLNVASDPEEVLKVTEQLLEVINSGVNKEMTYLIIDEFSFFTPYKHDKDKNIKEQIISNISLILRICRSENIRVILTTQKCHSDFLPTSISSLIEAKITFRCSDIASSTNVIGNGEATNLNPREFICVDSNGITKGKSYTMCV